MLVVGADSPRYWGQSLYEKAQVGGAFVAGGLQGVANVANVGTDIVYDMENLLRRGYNNSVGYIPGAGQYTYLQLPDWSYNLIVTENPGEHRISKGAGQVAITAFSLSKALTSLASLSPRAAGALGISGNAAVLSSSNSIASVVSNSLGVAANGGMVLGSYYHCMTLGANRGGNAPNNPSPRRGPTDPDVIAEEMGPGHFDTHGDPSSWKYLGKKTEPATEIGREAGSKKVYEVYLNESGKQVEWHYWRNPNGTVDGGKLKFPGTTSRSNLAY